MATSPGELLDRLTDTARIARPAAEAEGAVRADAGCALGQLGRALARLRQDGVSATVADERERQVADLAEACTQLAARAPVRDGRLTRLAATVADAVATAGAQTTVAGRWAAATELADAVLALNELVGHGPHLAEIAQRSAEIRRLTLQLQQSVALQPPERRDYEVLDRPIPNPNRIGQTAPDLVVREAIATLLRTSEQHTVPLNIADVLARTVAAESLTRAAETLTRRRPSTDRADAAEAWRVVRAALRPFEDGSRRPRNRPDQGQAAARAMHTVLHRAGADPNSWPPQLADAVAAATQLVPIHARQLERTVYRWAFSRAVLAYACDLPFREARVEAYLAGRRPAGLVHPDEADLRPVTKALRAVRSLSAAIADQAATARGEQPNFPRRAGTAHRALLADPEAATTPAVHDRAAYHRLHANAAHHAHPRPR